MPSRLEFFFDLSSPWTRLAFANVQPLIARTGADATFRPILVGGVFNAVNPAVYAAREQTDNRKMQHGWKVLADWARLAGVEMNFPSRWHPAKSVHAMRFATALEDDQPALLAFARAAFESYFGRQENLDDPAVLEAVATGAGLDGAAIRAASTTDAVKARLRANTEELVARGGYGSPTLFVDGTDMYFGNDQLPLVEAALQRN
ncbi:MULTISPECIES: 2-hydroxychromene-2-carboxylate isomerase [Sphingopyxis]|jgi:2-hydroxychromene-2-carboxylate isomerase|uniref:2-hydroxychromene-2-carboxylate isomerase n=1 Tax=Sphingopyxis TaxID=165697 RepID=UPI000868EA75|nr:MULTISPECIES: 2-hydroxychromene-2-carboxylate isomerase [Sphingopyxis]APW73489.1 2-hydroxychromene-2-carboxylate isomerase [Sphingopyxis granuli]AVA14531.1 2-hydroxychromene-2-carboxylate isomerase [Sphingopyxis sp. MG]ODU29878.1 MAG: 2-hydroxychromene-2-carboxylate isomerase [Sphingopyxis sp. SCN 67-31]